MKNDKWKMENAPSLMFSSTKKIGRPCIGLVLSGGAARGIAHLGVLRALEEHAIPIDVIAGASAGALVGGAYAAGMSVAQLEALARQLRWRHMGRMTLSRRGIQTSAPMEEFLRQHLPVTRFEELKIPFAALATDLRDGTPVVLSGTGDVPRAIRASCCVPGWYVPVTNGDGRQLVDGGLVAGLPISYARQLGADIVIAVDVNAEGAKFIDSPRSVIGVLVQAILAVERMVTSQQSKCADVLIVPKVGHIRWDETRRAEELLKAGYEATLELIDKIKQLAAPPTFPQSELMLSSSR
jgi:NTE family protein